MRTCRFRQACPLSVIAHKMNSAEPIQQSKRFVHDDARLSRDASQAVI